MLVRQVPLVVLVLVVAAQDAWADDASSTVDVAVDLDVTVDVDLGAEGIVDPGGAAAPADPSLLGRPHWEAQVSMQVGTSRLELDDLSSSPRIGLHAAAGRQLGPVRLGLEYSVTPFDGSRDVPDGYATRSEEVHGQLHRKGITARLRVPLFGGPAPGDPATPLRGEYGLYLDLGAGRQSVRLDRAAARTRDDVMVGFGVESALGGARRFGGFAVGGRVVAAVPEGDRPSDLAFFFQIGLLLGT